MAKWSVPLDKFAETVKLDLETVARKATLQIFQAVVAGSPVGNPELWIANESKGVGRSQRDLYQELAEANNADPTKRRMGTSRAALSKLFPLSAGKGYVGGRFRANWNVSYGAIDTAVTDSTAKERADGEVLKALTLEVGGIVYMTNSLPYALALENGHSSQAPLGMVRLAAVQWARAVRKAAR